MASRHQSEPSSRGASAGSKSAHAHSPASSQPLNMTCALTRGRHLSNASWGCPGSHNCDLNQGRVYTRARGPIRDASGIKTMACHLVARHPCSLIIATAARFCRSSAERLPSAYDKKPKLPEGIAAGLIEVDDGLVARRRLLWFCEVEPVPATSAELCCRPQRFCRAC